MQTVKNGSCKGCYLNLFLAHMGLGMGVPTVENRGWSSRWEFGERLEISGLDWRWWEKGREQILQRLVQMVGEPATIWLGDGCLGGRFLDDHFMALFRKHIGLWCMTVGTPLAKQHLQPYVCTTLRHIDVGRKIHQHINEETGRCNPSNTNCWGCPFSTDRWCNVAHIVYLRARAPFRHGTVSIYFSLTWF